MEMNKELYDFCIYRHVKKVFVRHKFQPTAQVQKLYTSGIL